MVQNNNNSTENLNNNVIENNSTENSSNNVIENNLTENSSNNVIENNSAENSSNNVIENNSAENSSNNVIENNNLTSAENSGNNVIIENSNKNSIENMGNNVIIINSIGESNNEVNVRVSEEEKEQDMSTAELMKASIKKICKKIVYIHYLKKPIINIISTDTQLIIYIIFTIFYNLYHNFGLIYKVYEHSEVFNLFFRISISLFLSMDIYVLIWILYGLIKIKSSLYYLVLLVFTIFDMCDKIYDGFIDLATNNKFYNVPINPKWCWIFYLFTFLVMIYCYYAIILSNTAFLDTYHKNLNDDKEYNIQMVKIINSKIEKIPDNYLFKTNSDDYSDNDEINNGVNGNNNGINMRDAESIASNSTGHSTCDVSQPILIHHKSKNSYSRNLTIRIDGNNINDLRHAYSNTGSIDSGIIIKGNTVFRVNTSNSANYSPIIRGNSSKSNLRTVSSLLSLSAQSSPTHSNIVSGHNNNLVQFRTQYEIQNKILNHEPCDIDNEKESSSLFRYDNASGHNNNLVQYRTQYEIQNKILNHEFISHPCNNNTDSLANEKEGSSLLFRYENASALSVDNSIENISPLPAYESSINEIPDYSDIHTDTSSFIDEKHRPVAIDINDVVDEDNMKLEKKILEDKLDFHNFDLLLDDKKGKEFNNVFCDNNNMNNNSNNVIRQLSKNNKDISYTSDSNIHQGESEYIDTEQFSESNGNTINIDIERISSRGIIEESINSNGLDDSEENKSQSQSKISQNKNNKVVEQADTTLFKELSRLIVNSDESSSENQPTANNTDDNIVKVFRSLDANLSRFNESITLTNISNPNNKENKN